MIPIGIGLVGMSAAAFMALKPVPTPPPPEIASDPFLVAGRSIYFARCVSCHGERGRGDGVLSKGLTRPKPRDFVEEPWKYGDRPDQALAIVSNGVPGTSMGGWKSSYSAEELRTVTAYLYYLAGKPVPESLRSP